jgi:CubicO group peptidase (beta-lactamase class C family)
MKPSPWIRLSFTLSLALSGAVLSDAGAARAQPAPPAPVRVEIPPGIRRLNIREEHIRAHVIQPPHVQQVVTEKGLEEGTLNIVGRIPLPGHVPHLNVGAFGTQLHAALKDSVVGYAMQLRQSGNPIYTLIWNWAQTPADASEGWNLDRHQHIASVSKLMTAIGMTKLLDEKHISYDAKIIDYLPGYWAKGPNINLISFRDLMTHRSGFNVAALPILPHPSGSASDYHTMKAQIANGVTAHGTYRYQNMNFGLCRILLSIIDGTIGKDFPIPPGLNADQFWDYVTIHEYEAYLRENVFTPSGVTGATLDHSQPFTLAYQFPANGPGWSSGDLSTVSGGAGWHMSVNEVLDVLGTFRRKGTIMSPQKAQAMLDNGFGIDVVAMNTAAGPLYNKNGAWGDSVGHEEQALAYFLPENMELVVLTNSPVGLQNTFFRDLVTNLYVKNVE